MQNPIAKTVAAAAIGVVLLGVGAAATPAVRDIASGWGLAVMRSGGDAEQVSEAQAREAILRGDRAAVDCKGSLFDFISIKMAHQPFVPEPSFRIGMAYKQAAMFTAFLQDSNPAAFARMMNAILDGRPFVGAVRANCGADVNALWEQFAQGLKN